MGADSQKWPLQKYTRFTGPDNKQSQTVASNSRISLVFEISHTLKSIAVIQDDIKLEDHPLLGPYAPSVRWKTNEVVFEASQQFKSIKFKIRFFDYDQTKQCLAALNCFISVTESCGSNSSQGSFGSNTSSGYDGVGIGGFPISYVKQVTNLNDHTYASASQPAPMRDYFGGNMRDRDSSTGQQRNQHHKLMDQGYNENAFLPPFQSHNYPAFSTPLKESQSRPSTNEIQEYVENAAKGPSQSSMKNSSTQTDPALSVDQDVIDSLVLQCLSDPDFAQIQKMVISSGQKLSSI